MVYIYSIDVLKHLNLSSSFKVHIEFTIPAALAGVFISSIPGNIASVSKTIELAGFIWTGNVKELWVLTSFPLMYTYDIQISNTNQI